MLCRNLHHEISHPSATRDGECRQCYYDRQRRHDDRRKLAMQLLQRMESLGIRESDLRDADGYAIALGWLAEESPSRLADIEAEHPAMIAKLRRQLDMN